MKNNQSQNSQEQPTKQDIERYENHLKIQGETIDAQMKIMQAQREIIESLKKEVKRWTAKKTIILHNIEKKGDVTFYQSETGRHFQKVINEHIFPVTRGKNEYRPLKQVNDCEIKYHKNGLYGFVIFQKGKIQRKNIWLFNEAIAEAKKLK